MAKLGKRTRSAREAFAGKEDITVEEALDLIKANATAKFDETVATITSKQLREIAEAKMVDLSANDVDAAMQIILGSARSMGIEVKG
jgi:ribosomal protein L11